MSEFPSPIGVLYISIEGEELELIDSYSFRPLLGSLYFNKQRKAELQQS